MTFNFDKAIKDSLASSKSAQIGAIVLGPSGSGKSTLMGTFGCKTLYIYTTGESHGAKAAMATAGDDIVPVMIDFDEEKLSPDLSYKRLLEVLGSGEQLKEMGIGAVVLDSASEIEAIIRGTAQWKEECKTAQGKHSTFEEPTATRSLFRPIVDALKALQRDYGMHFAMTCILDVKEVGPYGEIAAATPRLGGFSVAESLVQQFGEVLVVGRMVRDDVVKHKIQFMTDLSKVSKDDKGVVKRAINFNPRVTGILLHELPPLMDADLSKVVELKKAKMGGKK